jgi:hypothetical protein
MHQDGEKHTSLLHAQVASWWMMPVYSRWLCICFKCEGVDSKFDCRGYQKFVWPWPPQSLERPWQLSGALRYGKTYLRAIQNLSNCWKPLIKLKCTTRLTMYPTYKNKGSTSAIVWREAFMIQVSETWILWLLWLYISYSPDYTANF